MPLRTYIEKAVRSRRMILATGHSRRADHDALWASLGRAEVFLRSYPYATDERCREWCAAHEADWDRILTTGMKATFRAMLRADELKAK